MQLMITNGGPHPADKWAEVTTQAILDLIQIDNDSVSPEAAAARQVKRDLRPILFNIFNAHHDRVQKHEQGELVKEARKRIASGVLNPTGHLPDAMIALNAALAATPFQAHFEQPEVQDILRAIVGQHTADVMHIERQWHGKPRGKETV